ncbi:TPA: glycosyltransferase [Neisseria meningitidis]
MIFSIIVPIYNVEKYLRCCVDSVLAENFADYEMILVDDGSPDGCGKICDEYAGKYPHIKVIHQENGGLSDARNAGIRAAKGDYLIFLDSDDYWADTNRSKNARGGGILFDLQQLADKKVDLILHPSSFNYRDIPKGADFSDNDFVRHFETLVEGRYYIANAWTKIVRREIIIKNNLFFPKGYIHEDFPYSLKLARFVKTFAFYDNPFYQYRVLGNSISHNVKYKNFSDMLAHLDRGVDFLVENRNSPIYGGLQKFVFDNIGYLRSISVRLYFSKNIIVVYREYFSFKEKCRKIFGAKAIRPIFIGKTAFIIGLPILRLLVPPMLYPAIKAVYQKFFSE